MPKVIATGLDYSARRLSGQKIRDAGYRFVNRYLWFPGQRWPALTAEEYADLAAHGIEVHAIYEQNTNDPAGGHAAGQRMGRQAVESARAAGLPAGHTIYMCADAWLATHGIPVATAMRFLDGARSVIDPAGYVTGAYGFRDFVYAAQDGGHADRFWLCGAESGVREGIHQYQWNNGRVYVDGLECDLNKQYLPMKDEDDMSWTDKIAVASPGDRDYKEQGEAAQFVGDTYFRVADIFKEWPGLVESVAEVKARLDAVSTGTGYTLQEIAAAVAPAVVAELKKEGN